MRGEMANRGGGDDKEGRDEERERREIRELSRTVDPNPHSISLLDPHSAEFIPKSFVDALCTS